MQRLRGKLPGFSWLGVLWSLALLGLFLLPSDYRAGGEMAHGHSLVQLWVDAADGHVDHHHDGAAHVHVAGLDWLDPAVGSLDPDAQDPYRSGGFDVGEQQDSTPAPGAVHLLLVALVVLPVVPPARQHPHDPVRTPTGRSPQVLFPPPRWTPAAS